MAVILSPPAAHEGGARARRKVQRQVLDPICYHYTRYRDKVSSGLGELGFRYPNSAANTDVGCMTVGPCRGRRKSWKGRSHTRAEDSMRVSSPSRGDRP